MSFHRLERIQANSRLLIHLPASKSISNRLLIIQALSNFQFEIENLSKAKDTSILQEALLSRKKGIDVGMAGTAYRFLTAFLAIKPSNIVKLSGADRMHERPIGILVEALKELGAEIDYLEKKYYPPLVIKGRNLVEKELQIDASVSSQFVSALLLIAPYIKGGLTLKLVEGESSKPYVEMTRSLMNACGVKSERIRNYLIVEEGAYTFKQSIRVEADWSSAAFFYQVLLFNDQLYEIQFEALSLASIQGDQALAELASIFGVETIEENGNVIIRKCGERKELTRLNLIDCPDLAPSLIVIAALNCNELIIDGIKTLRIKECNRIKALSNELQKIGAQLIEVTNDQIMIKKTDGLPDKVEFNTYNDHRMAMCLAPLAFVIDEVKIENIKVVKKSFPNYWLELEKCGIKAS